MPKYLIYACESQYGGLHGMYDWTIEECTYDEAEEIGMQMALDVQGSYSCLIDTIQDQAQEKWEWEYDTIDQNEADDWISDRVDGIMHENAEYQIFRLRDSVNYDEIDLDWDDIASKYGIREERE